MKRRFPCAASRCCFVLGWACATSSYAVNFEFSPAAPAERVGILVHAETGSPVGPSNSTHSDADLPSASAFAEAGATRSTPSGPVVIVSAEARGEIESNLELDSPAAFVRLVTPNSKVTGLVAEPVSNYAATMSAVSGIDTINPIAIGWRIDVLPSAGETAGAPTQISLDTVAEGVLTTNGRSVADARWLVVVNETTPILSGSARAAGGNVVPFSNAASYDFVVPLGSSFQLRIDWGLSIFGAGSSTAEFTTARVDLAATIIPEPGASLLLVIGLVGLGGLRQRTPSAA